MKKEPPETYQQMVDRIAYATVIGFVRGTSLQDLTHHAVQQAILWHVNKKEHEAAEKKAARKQRK
jgi:hypothetical protein